MHFPPYIYPSVSYISHISCVCHLLYMIPLMGHLGYYNVHISYLILAYHIWTVNCHRFIRLFSIYITFFWSFILHIISYRLLIRLLMLYPFIAIIYIYIYITYFIAVSSTKKISMFQTRLFFKEIYFTIRQK
jgi:hypothetical protein